MDLVGLVIQLLIHLKMHAGKCCPQLMVGTFRWWFLLCLGLVRLWTLHSFSLQALNAFFRILPVLTLSILYTSFPLCSTTLYSPCHRLPIFFPFPWTISDDDQCSRFILLYGKGCQWQQLPLRKPNPKLIHIFNDGIFLWTFNQPGVRIHSLLSLFVGNLNWSQCCLWTL